MATSFGALCTDFYMNLELTMKLPLPTERETVVHMFDGIRARFADMVKFRPYDGEISLESPRDDGEYRWASIQNKSLRSGHVNPKTMDSGYELHELLLQIAPFHLTISPLDIAQVELLYGFDLDCKGNHHEVVYEALYGDSPLAGLVEAVEGKASSIEPQFGMMVDVEGHPMEVTFDVKCRTTKGQIVSDHYRPEPISVFMSIKRRGPVDKPEDLLEILKVLRGKATQLSEDHLIPDLLMPIKSAIPSSA